MGEPMLGTDDSFLAGQTLAPDPSFEPAGHGVAWMVAAGGPVSLTLPAVLDAR